LYEDIAGPGIYHQKDDTMEEADVDTKQHVMTELPPSGSGAHAPTRGTATATEAGGTATAGAPQPTAPTRLIFGTHAPPTIPINRGAGTIPYIPNIVEHTIRFTPLREHGANSEEQGSLNLSSGILRGGSSSASSSRGSRGREPIPLTPEILHLLDRLELDKGKRARLLTEHLTGEETLPITEQELQKLLERKAEKEIKRQEAAAEAADNRAAEEHMEAHEAAMAAHLAQQATAAALAARATQDEEIVAGHVVMEAATGADGLAHMLD
jgi:hypothetical protein